MNEAGGSAEKLAKLVYGVVMVLSEIKYCGAFAGLPLNPYFTCTSNNVWRLSLHS